MAASTKHFIFRRVRLSERRHLQRLQVFNHVALFSISQVQSLEFVVVIDDLEQSRKATIVVEATRLVGPESFERRRTVGVQTVTQLWRNRALLQQTIESRKRTLWGCCQSKLPDDDHKLGGPCSSVLNTHIKNDTSLLIHSSHLLIGFEYLCASARNGYHRLC